MRRFIAARVRTDDPGMSRPDDAWRRVTGLAAAEQLLARSLPIYAEIARFRAGISTAVK